MPIQVLQRPFWDGRPVKQAELMLLTKDRDDGRTRVAVLEKAIAVLKTPKVMVPDRPI